LYETAVTRILFSSYALDKHKVSHLLCQNIPLLALFLCSWICLHLQKVNTDQVLEMVLRDGSDLEEEESEEECFDDEESDLNSFNDFPSDEGSFLEGPDKHS